jgi:hypothetical protein
MLNVKNAKTRSLLIIVIILAVYISRYIFMIRYDETIFDNLTTSIYNYLRAYNKLRNNLQIFNYLMLDFILIITCYLWILHDKSWRLIMSLSLFYMLKLSISLIFEQKHHEDMIWYYPGVSFISTTYYPSNINFICGTSGLYIILLLEISKIKYRILSKILSPFIILNTLLLLCLRASTFISIFSGMILGYYCFKLSSKHSNIFKYLYDFDKAIRYSNIKYTNLNSQSSGNTIDNFMSMTVDSKPEDVIKIYENVTIPCGYNISEFIYSYSAVSIAGQRY